MLPLVFVDILSAQPNTLITSNTQTVSTTNPVVLTVTNGNLVINGTVSLSSTNILNDQDQVAIQLEITTADVPYVAFITSDDGQIFTFHGLAPSGNQVNTLININFGPKVVKFNTVVNSPIIPISGLTNGSVNIYVDPILNASVILNGTNLSSNTCTVSNDDTLQFEITVPPSSGYDEQYNIVIFCGLVPYVWTLVARNSYSIPDPLQFIPLADVEVNTVIESNPVTISGIDADVLLNAYVDVGTIQQNGVDVGQTTIVALNDVLTLTITSALEYKTPTFSVLTLDTNAYSFGVITKQDPSQLFVEDAFACDDVSSYPFVGKPDVSANAICALTDGTTSFIQIDATIPVTGDAFLNDGYIAISDYYAGTVLIIDYLAGTVVKTIAGFVNPIELGYSVPDYFNRTTIVVADAGSKQLMFLDTDTYDLRSEFEACIASPKGVSTGFFNTLYVSFDNDTLIKYSTNGYALTHVTTYTFPSKSSPGNLYNDELYVFVPLTCSNQVAVVNVETDVVTYITIEGSPSSVVTDDASTYLYIADAYLNTVVRVDYGTWSNPLVFYVCDYPTQITYYNNSIYVAAFQTNTIYQYDATTQLLVNTTQLPNSCYGLAADGLGEIWAVSFYKNTPTVISIPNLKVATETLQSLNDPVKVNVVDYTNSVPYKSRRKTQVSAPQNFHDTTLAINGVDTSNSVILANQSVSLKATTNVDGYDAYIPLLSPSNATVFDVKSLVTTPLPFYFDTVYGAYVRHWYQSNDIIIRGLSPNYSCKLAVTIGPLALDTQGNAIYPDRVDDCFIFLNNIRQKTGNINVKNGDIIHIKFKSKRYYTNGNALTVTAGQFSTTWSVYNLNMVGATDFANYRDAQPVDQSIGIHAFDYSVIVASLTLNGSIDVVPHLYAHVNSPASITGIVAYASAVRNSFIEAPLTYTESPRHAYYDDSIVDLTSSGNGFVTIKPSSMVETARPSVPTLDKPRVFAINYGSVTFQAIKIYEITIPKVSFINYTVLKTKLEFESHLTYMRQSFKDLVPSSPDFINLSLKDLVPSSPDFINLSLKNLVLNTFDFINSTSKDLVPSSPDFINLSLKNLVLNTFDFTHFEPKNLPAATPSYYIFEPKNLPSNKPIYYIFEPKTASVKLNFTSLVQKYVIKPNSNFVRLISANRYTIGRVPAKLAKLWYSCFVSCTDSGMFNSSSEALADAIRHGYPPSKVQVSKDIHGCWLWSVLNKPTFSQKIPIAGWMRGG